MSTSDRDCPQCGAVTGHFLCFACVKDLRSELETVPMLTEELPLAVVRMTRAGGPFRDGGRSTTTPLPVDLDASDIAWCLHSTLAIWARELCEERGIEYVPAGYVGRRFVGPLPIGIRRVPAVYVDTAAGLANWLRDNAITIALSPSAGQCYDEITDTIAAAFRVVEGQHDAEIDDEERLLSANEIEDEYKIPAKRIRVWASRGRVHVRGKNLSTGENRFRVGDVLDRAGER